VPPFILQSEEPNIGGLPKPVPFRPDLPDNHLAYAVTWFSFAAILLVIYVMMSRRRAS
jgi:surfeit locus 1 family protein